MTTMISITLQSSFGLVSTHESTMFREGIVLKCRRVFSKYLGLGTPGSARDHSSLIQDHFPHYFVLDTLNI